MKAIMSNLLKQILKNRQSALNLKNALDRVNMGEEDVEFIHGEDTYIVALIQVPKNLESED